MQLGNDGAMVQTMSKRMCKQKKKWKLDGTQCFRVSYKSKGGDIRNRAQEVGRNRGIIALFKVTMCKAPRGEKMGQYEVRAWSIASSQ